MSIAAQYAKALHELAEKNPENAQKYLKNLRELLRRRGHEKLLTTIWSEYQKLQVAQERTRKHRSITPEIERTDKLLQLYRQLISK